MRKGYLRRGGKGRISGGCRMTDWLMEVGGWLALKRFAGTEGLDGKSVCRVRTKGTRWIILNVCVIGKDPGSCNGRTRCDEGVQSEALIFLVKLK